MEQNTTYVVQAWAEGYGYWATTSEPTEGLFTLPVISYESEADGRARLNRLREIYPSGKYRLVRVVTTVEEI
jgi:hypothetical protein